MFYNRPCDMTLLLERTGPIGLSSTPRAAWVIAPALGYCFRNGDGQSLPVRDTRQAGVMATASDDTELNLIVTGSSTTGLKSEFVRTTSASRLG